MRRSGGYRGPYLDLVHGERQVSLVVEYLGVLVNVCEASIEVHHELACVVANYNSSK